VGLVALYTGLLLWRLYVRLDSVRYPILSYADIVERIFGMRARRVSIVLQSVQLVVFVRIFNTDPKALQLMFRQVGIICLGNAQALTQIAKNRVREASLFEDNAINGLGSYVSPSVLSYGLSSAWSSVRSER
jgi:hypothetical protein